MKKFIKFLYHYLFPEETPKPITRQEIEEIVKTVLPAQNPIRIKAENIIRKTDIKSIKRYSVSFTPPALSTFPVGSVIALALQALPNQQFTTTLDGNIYTITLKSNGGIITTSITRNNIPLTTNLICPANTPLLPYAYLEDGNFLIVTNNGELPDYTQFGITQQLVYVSQATLGVIRGTN